MHRGTPISGLGIICSCGTSLEEVWSSLRHGPIAPETPARALFYPHPASPLFTVPHEDIITLCNGSFLSELNVDPLESLNRTIALALKAIDEALTSAGLTPSTLRHRKVGIAMGTTVGCTFHNENYYVDWKSGKPQSLQPVYTYLASNIAERIQKILGIQGPRAVITNACASGTDAIGLARNWLAEGFCDIAIAGGCDEISRIACHGFSSLMLFAPSACTPFARDRQGLNLGEGAGVVVLESEKELAARKGNLMGFLRGYGTASDAYHPTAPHPEGRGLQQAIRTACGEAGVTIDEIGYINAHGTGTQANDKAELTALAAAGVASETPPPIVSTKGATGHTLGAAGGVEAVIAMKSLLERTAFGTIGCMVQDEKLALPVLLQGHRKNIASPFGMSQSLAFGGGNSAIILEAPP